MNDLLELERMLQPIDPPRPHRPLLHAAQAVVLMLSFVAFMAMAVGFFVHKQAPDPPVEHKPTGVTTTGGPR